MRQFSANKICKFLSMSSDIFSIQLAKCPMYVYVSKNTAPRYSICRAFTRHIESRGIFF